MNEKTSIKEKISTGVANLKKHWETPPDGYYVNYKEFLNLALGSGSISWLSVIVSWTTIAINIPMMISYFKVSTGFIFVSGIVASIFGLVRAPILATVYKGNIIKNLIMDCQSYAKYRPNETTGGIFVSWRRKEELPTGA